MKRILMMLFVLLMMNTRALAQEYYTLSQIKEQAAQGWHETYMDKYGRIRRVDIDMDVFGEKNAPVLVAGWREDGLQNFHFEGTSPREAIKKAREKGKSLSIYPYQGISGMKVDLDQKYAEAYGNDLTLREMYAFLEEHLKKLYVDQEYVWEQPKSFSVLYGRDKKNGEVCVPALYSLCLWPQAFGLPILTNLADSFKRHVDGPVITPDLQFDMRDRSEYAGGGTAWDIKEVLAEDIPLCSVNQVIEGAREMIENGYIHEVLSLRFGYAVYHDPNDEWGKQRSLYDMDTIWYLVPSWVMECYILENPKVDELGEYPNVWEMTINAQTGKMMDHFDQSLHGRGDPRYKGFISWEDVK